jgi:hypothetical protein
LLVLALLAVVSGAFLTVRGKAALKKSDHAFHQGDMRQSIAYARQSALAYVPGAEHVGAAYSRLEAIARGAESEGDEALARVAWDTLRVVVVQTEYLGRPPSPALDLAEKNLKRLRAAREREAAEE